MKRMDCGRMTLPIVLCLALVLATGLTTLADELADNACKVIETNKDSVVTVELVVSLDISFNGQSKKQEVNLPATATVVDSSGLVVAALSATSPEDSVRQSVAGLEVKSKVVDAKLKMPEGDDIPVDIVLRDPDMDLIFFKPKKALEKPMKCVDLSQPGSPVLMQQTILLNRLGAVANRSIVTGTNRIGAVLTKPRLAYVLSDGYQANGSPVFTTDGKFIGIMAVRKSAGSSGNANSLFVVVPCSAIKDGSGQAKIAKPAKDGDAASDASKKLTTAEKGK